MCIIHQEPAVKFCLKFGEGVLFKVQITNMFWF